MILEYQCLIIRTVLKMINQRAETFLQPLELSRQLPFQVFLNIEI